MRALMIAAALSLVFVAPSQAQKIDANGRCHAADGKFAKAEVCAKAKPPEPPKKCRDMKTKKFAKCGGPGVEAVPSK